MKNSYSMKIFSKYNNNQNIPTEKSIYQINGYNISRNVHQNNINYEIQTDNSSILFPIQEKDFNINYSSLSPKVEKSHNILQPSFNIPISSRIQKKNIQRSHDNMRQMYYSPRPAHSHPNINGKYKIIKIIKILII